MKSFKILALCALYSVITSCNPSPGKTVQASSVVTFTEGKSRFTPAQEELIQDIVQTSELKVRELLPNLPDSINVAVEIVDWNIDVVGGVTGRTETNSPPQVVIQISETYPGGVSKAAETALEHTIFHEFHHLYRGWAIQDNKFGPGIDIAAVNEGLAVVFSEVYTVAMEADSPPEATEAEEWVTEILALPVNANYQHWMFQHPDGRESVGYRTGNYIVSKALAASGKNILELSELPPNEILTLAGY
ncbi:DUF2268 domain-containing putative Zn-dependent protease [Flagellimonas sp.]|uniref:DUF2268 domain-containing putative Zn-dependent protease n=1 Tax=Flagellimonas sp. TaxID=2058762 RepID=UPI003BAB865C